jgi:hypothetical protein
MMPVRPVFYLVIVTALLLCACAPSAAAPDLPQATSVTIKENASAMPYSDSTNGNSAESSPTSPVDQPQTFPASADPLLKKIAGLAISDLAARLKLDENSIVMASADSINWPNSALGCPKPDKVYAQGRVPGFRIKLTTGGKEYIYNTDRTGILVQCPQAAPGDVDGPSAPVSPGDTLGGQIK